MRELRVLAADAWYNISTAINNSEPLFQSPQDWQVHLFHRVLIETREIYEFEMRGLRLEGPLVMFYIKPANGFQLPEIMQWLKQTFATRFNVIDGRTGHIWGERYWSEILPGEPPKWAEAYAFEPVVRAANHRVHRQWVALCGGGDVVRDAATDIPTAGIGGCPRPRRRTGITHIKLKFPRRAASQSG